MGIEMTLQQLRYAVMVSDCKSMNKAAEKLFITQPSLSGTIKDLEKEINVNLFIRSNRGIIITPEGEEFLGYARQMLEHYKLIEDRFVNSSISKKKFSETCFNPRPIQLVLILILTDKLMFCPSLL